MKNDAKSIQNAINNAIHTLGKIPAVSYRDNGKAMCCGLCQKIGVIALNVKPYEPTIKPTEGADL